MQVFHTILPELPEWPNWEKLDWTVEKILCSMVFKDDFKRLCVYINIIYSDVISNALCVFATKTDKQRPYMVACC